MVGPFARVKPELLVWARTSAGLTLADAAKRMNVEPARLASWESGAERLTIAQLRKFADACKRPLAVFFLATPPKGWDAMKDFRLVAGTAPREQSYELRLAIREAWERRAVCVELAHDLDRAVAGIEPPKGRARDPEVTAQHIRKQLGVSLAEQRQWGGADVAFSRWRTIIEARDILVFSFPAVDVEEARGFAINHRPFPVIAVNSNDMPAGRAFTLLHELCHVLSRDETSVCSLTDTGDEVFCNHVAAAVLMPRDALFADGDVSAASSSSRWSDDALKKYARLYGVSREVVLRRLLTLGKTSQSFYSEKRALFLEEYRQWSRKRKESEGGPTYLATVISRHGRLYPRVVCEAYGQATITASEASTYLGVKTKHLPSLESDVFMHAHP
jgi:Zn-dependent peptidase ImmA (M78 family)